MLKLLHAAAMVPLLCLASAAQASIVADTTYYFSGTCTDCSGQGVGELVLAGYTLGDEINSSNFVSFHYDGSNLFGAFTILDADTTFIGGAIQGPLPGPGDLHLQTVSLYIDTFNDGSWSLGSNTSPEDDGTAGTYSDVAPTAVPEPVTAALLVAGLAGTAISRRRVA